LSSEILRKPSEFGLAPDEWLAGILSRPVWRLLKRAGAPQLGELLSAKSGFAYAKCDVFEVETVSRLVDKGFRVVDTALTFDGVNLAGNPSSHATRPANPLDEEAVRGIAGSAFRFSRFHLDPEIPPNLANTIKREWAGNFFSGSRGDGMVVVESAGQVAGFLQLIWGNGDALIIDLIGIHPDFQGRGLGKALVLHAIKHGTGDGRVPTGIIVGTQAANTPSIRLYESLGLRLRSAQYVLHFHCLKSISSP
jgi:ribosomal protein S18 acetylase RimI-like enzyme